MGDTGHADEISYEYVAGQCSRGEVKTPFATDKDMDQMKAMLAPAAPELVLKSAAAWRKVADLLAKGDGSVKSSFDEAVDNILQHWEGQAADAFAQKARQISKSLQDTSTYADYTATAMETAGKHLQTTKPEVDSMEKPSGFSSAMDSIGNLGSRNEDWQGDIQGNQGAQRALDGHAGDLSEGKERQLEMAAKMETLALVYSQQTSTMGTWRKSRDVREDGEDFPGDPGGVPPVPIPTPAGGGSPRATAVSRGTTAPVSPISSSKPVAPPREPGISGGVQKPVASTTPSLGTSLDGISGGLGTGPGAAGSPAGGGGSAGAVSGGAGNAGGVAGGLPGAARGTSGAAKGAAGAARAAASRAGGAGAAGGRGMPGAGTGAGGKSGAASARGGLARQRGGVVGAPGSAGTRGAQGGSGLHQSRGATAAGKAGNKGRGGMMGRGMNTSPDEEERREGERPDYLVEDEETWIPQRDVAPRVIE